MYVKTDAHVLRKSPENQEKYEVTLKRGALKEGR
jgi:hypothetical protein